MLCLFCYWILSTWLEPDFQGWTRKRRLGKEAITTISLKARRRGHHNHKLKGYRQLPSLNGCQNIWGLEISSTNTSWVPIMCWALFSPVVLPVYPLNAHKMLWHLFPFLPSVPEHTGVVKWLAQDIKQIQPISQESQLGSLSTIIPCYESLIGLFRGQLLFFRMSMMSIAIFYLALGYRNGFYLLCSVT